MARLEMTYQAGRDRQTESIQNNRFNYLVDVHVALGTTAGLEYNQGEVVYQLAGDDLHGPCYSVWGSSRLM